jgi:hypothetical protein
MQLQYDLYMEASLGKLKERPDLYDTEKLEQVFHREYFDQSGDVGFYNRLYGYRDLHLFPGLLALLRAESWEGEVRMTHRRLEVIPEMISTELAIRDDAVTQFNNHLWTLAFGKSIAEANEQNTSGALRVSNAAVPIFTSSAELTEARKVVKELLMRVDRALDTDISDRRARTFLAQTLRPRLLALELLLGGSAPDSQQASAGRQDASVVASNVKGMFTAAAQWLHMAPVIADSDEAASNLETFVHAAADAAKDIFT